MGTRAAVGSAHFPTERTNIHYLLINYNKPS
nr:MAG TPA: hypothetical protein [Caudoviricetes sp.]DAI84471.1 MAG TPA: hypothetical protein [Caudoviricetes sp.]